MLTTARVPPAFQPPFEKAESFVKKHFGDLQLRPDKGTVHISGDRYVLVRAESLYLAWFDALANSFGVAAAREFIYNTAREIGVNDCTTFSERLKVTDGVERLASGPIHFAYAGWAFVDICADSQPSPDNNYFLHYHHPNTFETEVLQKRGIRRTETACHFSAGYSSGWCTAAFGVLVHAREVRCVAKGDKSCEFIMAPQQRLDEHEARVRAGWQLQ